MNSMALTLARRASHFTGLASHTEIVSDHVSQGVADMASLRIGFIYLAQRIAMGIASPVHSLKV